jgi:ABC-type branched-subunit amino acid transport system permease subunit
MTRQDRTWLGLALALFALLAAYPAIASMSQVAGLRDILLFALFAVALDLFWGRTGILSFGHATFFGLGAYGMAVFTIHLAPGAPWASLVGLGFAVVLAGLVALVVGYFIIFGAVRGAYFTIVTLALTLVAQQIAVGWSPVTGGDAGLIGVPPLWLGVWVTGLPFFYLVLAVLVLVVLGLWGALRGRRGLILRAIEDDERKAQTLGYNTSAHLLATYTASGLIAGMAGALYATGTGFVAPDMIALLLSTEVIMWVAVGGRGSLIGAVGGTIIVWQLQQRVSSLNASAWPLFIGGFFMAMVFLFPDGLPAAARKLWARARGTPR